MARARVVLPDPDSPTMAKVSRIAMEKETPATASTIAGSPVIHADKRPRTG
jgi:hypothetical protein